MAEKKIVRRGSGPFVISGNHLRDGYVVWLADGERWSRNFAEAQLLPTEDEAAAYMNIVTADRRELVVVDIHIVDVTTGEDGARPVTYRERVRAYGPTIPIVSESPI